MDSMMPMGGIEDVAAAGYVFLYCDSNAVRIDKIAPGLIFFYLLLFIILFINFNYCLDIALKHLQHMSVEYSSLEIIQKVGEGGFASVFYGTHNGKEIAIKKIDKNESLAECFPEFRKEVSLMAGLQHPNTVGLIGLCMQPFCIITEFCPYGDLYSYIASRRERKLPLPFDYIMDVLVDIAHGKSSN